MIAEENRTDAPGVAALLIVAALCGALGWWVRSVQAIGIRTDDANVEESWGSYDPDTLYHARRVARATREGGWIAARDPLLPNPGGAGDSGAIPWPPAYDLLLATLWRGALPDPSRLPTFGLGNAKDGRLVDPDSAPVQRVEPMTPAERGRIERFVASAPRAFGALAAAIAALVAASFARRSFGAGALPSLLGGLFAGVTLAMTYGHVRYSHIGNGDHHAFVSLLHLVLLGLVTRGLAPDRIDRPIGSAVRGTLAGLVAALIVTTWTAGILWIALIQVAFVVRLFRRERAPDGAPIYARGLPVFATSFHKAVLLGLLPAILHSPFTFEDPWSLVELSWFHGVLLGVGWLVFAPWALVPKLVRGRKLAALAPAALVAFIVLVSAPIGSGLADAFSWAGARNAFMSSITESRPLLFGEGGSFGVLLQYCGIGVLVAPIVVVRLAQRARRRADALPFALTLPVCVVLALLQRRFAESLAPVLAVSLGAFVATSIPNVAGARRWGIGIALAVLAAALNPSQLRNVRGFMQRNADVGRFAVVSTEAKRQLAVAEVLDSMPPPTDAWQGAVLAPWDLGHAIEFRGGRRTVATNFGLYLGEESFLDHWRLWFTLGMGDVEAKLTTLGVSHVLFDGDRDRETAARALGGSFDTDVVSWRPSLAARLLGGGDEPEPVPPFLRLERMVPEHDGVPAVRLYECVLGATARASGESLSVVATVSYPGGSPVIELWRTNAVAKDGVLETRVPYATAEGREHGRVVLPEVTLEAFVDGRAVPLELTDDDVRSGRVRLIEN